MSLETELMGSLGTVKIIDHPLAGNYFRILRNRDTRVEDFRQAMYRLGLLLAVEATRGLLTTVGSVVTPLDVETTCHYVEESSVMLVPILRAGLGLLDSFLEVMPGARVAHIGISRDHVTLEAKPYLDSVPAQTEGFDRVIILDPMLATGNSIIKALEIIVKKGYNPRQIIMVNALATQQGIGQVQGKFPEVDIITGVIDPSLNDKAYIVPGLGDAGDRLYLF
jgi:uracil phosphoribosyltransferase